MNRCSTEYSFFCQIDHKNILLAKQRVRHYRFINELPYHIFLPNPLKMTQMNSLTKRIKRLYKLGQTVSTRSMIATERSCRTLKSVIIEQNINESPETILKTLIPKFKALETIAVENISTLLEKPILRYLRAQTKLKRMKITIGNSDQDYHDLNLLLRLRHFNNLFLRVFSCQPSQSKNSLHLGLSQNIDKLFLSLQNSAVNLIEIFEDKRVREITDTLILGRVSATSKGIEFLERLRKTLETMENTKSLRTEAQRYDDSLIKKVLSPALNKMKSLENFEYKGLLLGPQFSELDYSFLHEKLVSLKLEIEDETTNLQALEKFISNMRRLVNLQEFVFMTDDLYYANEFTHDLPHNLTNLKTVRFVFGKLNPHRDPKVEPRLHMNSLLDWLVSLPNLEEFVLNHPFLDYCYCHHLETCSLSKKLRKVIIAEKSISYDKSNIEAEYGEEDLAAALNLLLVPTLAMFKFSIHMECFSQRILDLFQEYITRCRKLRDLQLDIWFDILNEKLVYKVEKILKDLYYVQQQKAIKVRYYELANGITRDIVSGKKKIYGFGYSDVNFVGPHNGY